MDLRIKKAYRKKALELHPDRNYGNVEETTKLFAEVQSAYEILSDPQERAWYDSHRDAFLRGSDDTFGEQFEHNVRITTANDILKLFTLFNARVDFSDSPTGFYGVLRETFDTLAKEEELACEWEGLDSVVYPSFGHASDGYDDVVRPFYAVWTDFSTKKSFSSANVYRYSDAPDRRVRRMMEKENKRFREEGIREFNDAVRSLVAFVKKRDHRYKANVKSEAERQKTLRDAAIGQAARQRAANQAKQAQTETVPEWMRSSEVEDDDSSYDVADSVKEHFECVVCNKNFKSENQYEAHEKSKKHIRAIQHIKKQMQQEDESLQFEDAKPESADRKPSSDNIKKTIDAEDVRKEWSSVADEYDSQHLTSSVENHHQQPKAANLEHQSEVVREMDIEHNNRSLLIDSAASSSEDEYTTREKFKERILGAKQGIHIDCTGLSATQPDIDEISNQLASDSLGSGSGSVPQRRMGKAKEKRAKKAAKKQTAGAGGDSEFRCAACQAGFPSKTRLFNHIKDLNHAQPVSKPMKAGKNKK